MVMVLTNQNSPEAHESQILEQFTSQASSSNDKDLDVDLSDVY